MTVTVDRPTTRRRRERNRDRGVSTPTREQVEFAAQTIEDLAAHKPVYVSVQGHGGGWCVTDVDVYAFTYEVYRDRQSMPVGWAAVSQ